MGEYVCDGFIAHEDAIGDFDWNREFFWRMVMIGIELHGLIYDCYVINLEYLSLFNQFTNI